MRDFVDRGARRAPIKLPNDARVCFTVDLAFEGFLNFCQYRGRPTPPERPDLYSLSFAEYGLRVGVWRLLDIIQEFGLKVGSLTNGYAAQRYPKTVKALHDAGHEIVAHGWTNDAGIASEDEAVERSEIRRTVDAIVSATGARPVGWLSPGYSGSPARLKVLSEEGIFYSCDDAADDLPYVVSAAGRPHVILPRTSFGTNDLDNWFGPRLGATAWLETVKIQFDATYYEASRGRPGWMELVLHTHMAGRLQPMLAIREMIKHVMGHPGVWVATRREFAQWILDNPEFHG